MESLHPLVVHFPIALLLTALLCDVLAIGLKRPGLHRVALWNLSLGTLGAALAVLTGRQAAAVAKHSFDIWKVMELHERLGITTLSLGLVIAGVRFARKDQLTPRGRLVILIAMMIMAGTLTFGAYLGGRLVYEFGVGGRFGVPP